MNEHLKAIVDELRDLPLAERIERLNEIRRALHEVSPFRDEPVDCVEWIRSDSVVANDYNPNKVASPEMELLYRSIKEDGYTQPIVTFPQDETRIVVDGFHRNRIGREKKDIASRIHGYLPIVAIHKPLAERVASTIRHNRARGKHGVDLMAEIVIKLVNLGRTDKEICKELGMTGDELLRLKQQTGLAALFANQPYQRAWVHVDGEEGDESAEEEE